MKKRIGETTLYIKILLLALGMILIPMMFMFIYLMSGYEKFIRQEVGENLSRQIQGSEDSINEILENMVQLSNSFLADESLKKVYNPDEAKDLSYYEKVKIFDRYLSNISVYKITGLQDVKISFLDNDQRMYTNWSMAYQDYHYLFDKEWMRKGIQEYGVAWNLFADTFIENGEQGGYVSLARPVVDEYDSNKILGVLYISLKNKAFESMLEKYLYAENDSVGIYSQKGKALLVNGKELSQDQVKKIVESALGYGKLENVVTLEGTKYLITSYPISTLYTGKNEKLITIHLTDFQNVTDRFSQISKQMNIFLSVFILFIITMFLILSYSIVTPIKKLSSKMRHYKLGNEINGLDILRKDEIGVLNRSFLLMSDEIEGLFIKLEEEHHVRETYYYESLRAQMTPHFLFNSLNTIRWMAIIKGEEAIVAGIDALANMLKYNMNKTEELVTLKDEVDNISNYIYMQNLRYGTRLEITLDFQEELYSCKMVKFILQPIVENAVLHGFKDVGEGQIFIYGYIEDDMLKIFVEDNGGGLSEEAIDNFQNSKKDEPHIRKKMTGIGLNNVDYRIKAVYGEQYGIELDLTKKKGTAVIFSLPVIWIEEGCHEEDSDRR